MDGVGSDEPEECDEPGDSGVPWASGESEEPRGSEESCEPEGPGEPGVAGDSGESEEPEDSGRGG